MTDAKQLRLQNRVKAAVRHAVSDGELVSRTGIVSRFFGQGVSRAQLYRWVHDAIEDAGVAAADARQRGQPVHRVVKTLAETICITPLEDHVAIPDGNKPIPFMQIAKRSLRDLDRLRQLSHHSDGSIRNAWALLAVINEEIKLLAMARKMQTMWVNAQAQSEYLQQITHCIIGLPPEHRDPILTKIAALADELEIKLGNSHRSSKT